jgi:hypothetical protein
VLVRKFCVKRATLLEANAGWVEEFAQNGNVVMYPGQTIQIPPANS